MASRKEVSVANNRILRVVRFFEVKTKPYLPLKGIWLERAGFVIGTRVLVRVDLKRLIITTLDVEDAEK